MCWSYFGYFIRFGERTQDPDILDNVIPDLDDITPLPRDMVILFGLEQPKITHKNLIRLTHFHLWEMYKLRPLTLISNNTNEKDFVFGLLSNDIKSYQSHADKFHRLMCFKSAFDKSCLYPTMMMTFCYYKYQNDIYAAAIVWKCPFLSWPSRASGIILSLPLPLPLPMERSWWGHQISNYTKSKFNIKNKSYLMNHKRHFHNHYTIFKIFHYVTFHSQTWPQSDLFFRSKPKVKYFKKSYLMNHGRYFHNLYILL